MKREELKAKGFTDEQIEYIMGENGKDINAAKAETLRSLLCSSRLRTGTRTFRPSRMRKRPMKELPRN